MKRQKLFCEKSFSKDFGIILLEEKIGLKMNYLKKTGASQWCDWAGTFEKMGCSAGSVREGEMR
jgi:hypothetical protein